MCIVHFSSAVVSGFALKDKIWFYLTILLLLVRSSFCSQCKVLRYLELYFPPDGFKRKGQATKERPQHGDGHKGQCQGPLTPSPYPRTLFQHPPSPFNHCFHLLYQRIQILQVIPRTWPLTNIQLIFSVPINWLCAKMPSFDKNKTVYIPCY